MKTNHDGTITLNAYDTWTACVACGQRVTGDSIHTCSPQLKELNEEFEKGFKAGKEEGWKAHKFHHPVKELTDEEMLEICQRIGVDYGSWYIHEFARAILRKAQEK